MAFNQLVFPFIFLPVSFLVFKIVPIRFKKFALLLLSLLFITWGNPGDLPIVLLSVVFNYFSCLQISHLNQNNKEKKAKTVLVTAVAADILMLGFFKYFNFISNNIAGLFKITAVQNTMAVPVGISFFTFSVLSALFDVYRKKAEEPKNLLDFALFVTFFPKLSSGPIIQYKDMSIQLSSMKGSRANTEAGMRMFVVGLAKKVLLANTLNITFSAISGMQTASLTALSAWTGALSYSFMLYFDFS
ncbi:MAG: MBOAT family protein, partial [Clostridia bacterium]|nr:MBOAT family protein [Clostridia bacterium]